ncbi:MAG: LCP family protein [Candidatus Gracilibacteria bacterium]
MQQNLFKKQGINISIFLSLTVIVILCVLIIKVISGIDFKTLFLAAGESLETDKNSHTNFLIAGTGTIDHDGADLTDTIIVASLDQEKETISMVSIPRDLHIEDPSLQTPRINEIYFYAKESLGSDIEGFEYFKSKVEDLTGLDIQYYVKIDFDGFEKIIDTLGGIDIDVPEALYDPYYPKGESLYYEVFSVPEGPQHMDGETALKYARSRKTTSDFDRSSRQQQIIYAIKEKALQTEILLDKDKLSELFSAVKENVTTNLKIREMLTLGAIADKYNQDKIVNMLLHDDPVQCGGFLYAPPLENYNGTFVFTAAGGVEYIQRYFDLITNHQEAFKENSKIYILNGTSTPGIAAENKQVFQRYCMNPINFSNARSLDIKQTTIYYKMLPLPKASPSDKTEYYKPYTIDLIKAIIPEAIESTEIPQEYKDLGYDKDTDIILEIGSDYVDSDHYVEDSFYPLYSIIYAPKTDATEEAAAEAAAADTPPNE